MKQKILALFRLVSLASLLQAQVSFAAGDSLVSIDSYLTDLAVKTEDEDRSGTGKSYAQIMVKLDTSKIQHSRIFEPGTKEPIYIYSFSDLRHLRLEAFSNDYNTVVVT